MVAQTKPDTRVHLPGFPISVVRRHVQALRAQRRFRLHCKPINAGLLVATVKVIVAAPRPCRTGWRGSPAATSWTESGLKTGDTDELPLDDVRVTGQATGVKSRTKALGLHDPATKPLRERRSARSPGPRRSDPWPTPRRSVGPPCARSHGATESRRRSSTCLQLLGATATCPKYRVPSPRPTPTHAISAAPSRSPRRRR